MLRVLKFPRTREAASGLAARWPLLRVVPWWGLSFISMGVFALLRGRMDNVGFPVHGSELGAGLLGSGPTVWLQSHVYTLAPTELEALTVVIHASWFFVPPLVALFVSWKRPERIGSFFRWWVTLQMLSLICFALFPFSPPWMEDSEVIRIVAIRQGGTIDDSNTLAAMPSLHVAFPLLLSVWFFKENWKLPGILLGAYAFVIAIEVVFSGEHYAVDALGAGVIVAAVALASKIGVKGLARALRQPGSRRRVQGVGGALRSERGQAVIELALVLPIILLFLLVMVDFGLALDRRLVLQHAVSEGVREGAVSTEPSDVVDATVDESQGILSSGDVTVCYIDQNGDSTLGNIGDKVRVSATYDYEFSAGGGEMMQVFGVTPPTIEMTPEFTSALQTVVNGPTAC